MKELSFPTFVTAVIVHSGPGDGQVRGFSMQWARNLESAKYRIEQVFGSYYARKAHVSRGLRFIDELEDLITADLRAYAIELVKHTGVRAALFEYSSFSLRSLKLPPPQALADRKHKICLKTIRFRE